MKPSLFSIGAAVAAALFAFASPAFAADSAGCAGGGFRVVGFSPARTVTSAGTTNIAAGNVASSFQVIGKYVEFTVVTNNFGVENYVFTGATSPNDLTGGRRTVVWASRTPDLRGATLNSGVAITIGSGEIELTRTGPGVSMKITALDCASGGIFQAEPERADGQTTRFTHKVAGGMFYFEGDTLPYKDTTVVVPSRINIANDVSNRMIARDSPQVAPRVNSTSCLNQIQNCDGTFVTVQRGGQGSIWDVSSGGRMASSLEKTRRKSCRLHRRAPINAARKIGCVGVRCDPGETIGRRVSSRRAGCLSQKRLP